MGLTVNRLNIIELAGAAERTSTLTATGVDMRQYAGLAKIILLSSVATAGTTPTLDVKIEESDALASGYTDLAGATFAQVTDAADSTEAIQIDLSGTKRYIRVIGTIAGTSTPTFQFGVCAMAVRHGGTNSSQAV